ncbi:hypothetical protein CC78DRAFT_580976 [Lojkania enalia]|uniref:Swi5-domain-containing protein n=1 Tax=Lojkania enalia TaxID=147567 RepID=A0A9P4KCB7_9PLEO|nr:hypothetical protein CC78DRAFT_580976 [Didymosphaeria enalia]
MGINEGVIEVPDSEDEPMTSSPVAISDATIKLPVDVVQASQDVACLQQASGDDVSKEPLTRAESLGKTQAYASVDADALGEITTADVQSNNAPSRPEMAANLNCMTLGAQNAIDSNQTTDPNVKDGGQRNPPSSTSELGVRARDEMDQKSRSPKAIEVVPAPKDPQLAVPSSIQSDRNPRIERFEEMRQSLQRGSCGSERIDMDAPTATGANASLVVHDACLSAPENAVVGIHQTLPSLQAEPGGSAESPTPIASQPRVSAQKSTQEPIMFEQPVDEVSKKTSEPITAPRTAEPAPPVTHKPEVINVKSDMTTEEQDAVQPAEMSIVAPGFPNQRSSPEHVTSTGSPSRREGPLQISYKSLSSLNQDETPQICSPPALQKELARPNDRCQGLEMHRESATSSNINTPKMDIDSAASTRGQHFQPHSFATTKRINSKKPPSPKEISQEITLAELKAQRAALLASLATLPNVQKLISQNESSSLSSQAPSFEPTDTDLMAAANKLVKGHIKLLHEYNEIKDVGQGLMGLIADQRGVRIVEVQDEFGIGPKD